MLYAEPHILDLSLYKEENGRSKLLQVIGEAAKTGFIHIINHGLKPEWASSPQGVIRIDSDGYVVSKSARYHIHVHARDWQ